MRGVNRKAQKKVVGLHLHVHVRISEKRFVGGTAWPRGRGFPPLVKSEPPPVELYPCWGQLLLPVPSCWLGSTSG